MYREKWQHYIYNPQSVGPPAEEEEEEKCVKQKYDTLEIIVECIENQKLKM